jgi:hypothetical protein
LDDLEVSNLRGHEGSKVGTCAANVHRCATFFQVGTCGCEVFSFPPRQIAAELTIRVTATKVPRSLFMALPSVGH